MPNSDYNKGRKDGQRSGSSQPKTGRTSGPKERDYQKGYNQGTYDTTIQRQQRENSK